jgi:predicted small lipoprotein YifL
MKLMRLVLILSLAFAVPACGTKDKLLMPDGKPTPKGQKDPSLPPQPIQR